MLAWMPARTPPTTFFGREFRSGLDPLMSNYDWFRIHLKHASKSKPMDQYQTHILTRIWLWWSQTDFIHLCI